LAEILPLESADMYYQYVLPKSGKIKHNPEIGNPINALKWYNKGYTTSGKEPITLDEYCVPCWSLTALLSVITKQGLADLRFLQSTVDNRGNHLTNVWCCTFEDVGTVTLDLYANNPIDACCNMIIHLHELKMM
jgi:hypothetical protein